MTRTDTSLPRISIDDLRPEVVGEGYRIPTPYGERRMIYADYTASGRSVRFVERYLMRLQESYANTHTEDDETGRSTTEMLHRAEQIIKDAVNGNESTRIIEAGTGTTGAIQKIQEILGIYVPAATRKWVETQANHFMDQHGDGTRDALAAYGEHLRTHRPVVFVGPYEHHSNEVSWRESLAEVREITLGEDGMINLEDLERQVSAGEWEGRLKIGSFSAASNVTGVKTKVYDVARILHRNGALAFFDFAACAPYVEIDMNRDDESYFDALFFSPHKFLGGPGSSGVLLFRRELYPASLAPTFAAGGTVDYVGPNDHDFTDDIEAREKPGTPGTLQVMKAALAMELKDAVGVETIEEREYDYISRAIERLGANPNIELLGDPDPDRQIAILSFNLRDGERYLHPKLVTRLLNDLFGLQTRAGCSCAGPYGHRLLRIGQELSERYRTQINDGYQGIKPGWVRIGFHYTMDEVEYEFAVKAIEFLADRGAAFVAAYRFDMESGVWSHEDENERPTRFGIAEALEIAGVGKATVQSRRSETLTEAERIAVYDSYLNRAAEIAEELDNREDSCSELPGELGELCYFRFQGR